MNGLCTNCQVYFPMPPDFADGVPYACPQCNALLVPMQDGPAAAPPPPTEAAPPPTEAAPPPTEAAPPPPAEAAPPPPAEAAPPPPAAMDISTEEVTLPPVTPLDPPPEPAPAAANEATAAPISLTAGDDEPESNTLVTAVPDEVKAILAQQAAAAPAPPAAPAAPSGALPSALAERAEVMWFHPKVSPEVEASRARRAPPPPPAPTSSAFSMSGAGNGVAVEDLSGLSIPASPPAGGMASTVDTNPPGLDSELDLLDGSAVEEVPASPAKESSSYVMTGAGSRDEIPGARPKTPSRPAAEAKGEAKPPTSTPPGVRPPPGTGRPKITTATVKPVGKGGLGRAAVLILVLGLVGGGGWVAYAHPEWLPGPLRSALQGSGTSTGTAVATNEAATPDEVTPEPAGEGELELPDEGGDPEAVAGAEGAATEADDGAVPEEGPAGEDAPEGEAVVADSPEPGADATEEPDVAPEEAPRAPGRRVAAADRKARKSTRRPPRDTRRPRGTEAAADPAKKPPVAPPAEKVTEAEVEEKPPVAPAEDDPKVKARDHVRAGNSFLKQGKVDQAITQYEKAILLDGRSAAAHRGLGVAYASLGRAKEAVREYEHYLKLSPKARDAAQVKAIVDQYYASQAK